MFQGPRKVRYSSESKSEPHSKAHLHTTPSEHPHADSISSDADDVVGKSDDPVPVGD